MHNYVLFIVCEVFILFSSVVLGANDISGYYWRDYTGNIPHDAIPGGKEGGLTNYVGQALYTTLIVPAKIVAEEKRAYFEWGFQAHSANESVKILCTSHPESFHWAQAGIHSFGKITDKHFIVAGYEPGGTLYVGRQKNEVGDVILGKLLFNNDGAVLHSAYKGQGIMHYDFEVLYFDPFKTQKKPTECKCNDRHMTINLYC